jgi:hypothetical protein
MIDLELLSAKFLSCELPPHKTYLHKYFNGDIQERYVVYFLTFPYDGNFKRYYQNVIDHTGIYCSERWVYRLLKKIRKVEARMEKAVNDKDHETVALIKSGKWVEKWDKD